MRYNILITTAKEVMFLPDFAFWLVCERNNLKCYEQFSMKFYFVNIHLKDMRSLNFTV